MLEKLSVRKPLTVLVMVILIIVLGTVSFMNTTTDLLPSLNLPYAIIMTAYGGATPEQVEMEVTIPIEGRMGTVSGIKNISSTSSEHFSLVILEFTDTTNMDFASIEIREALDMINFPEGANKPTIMRLNPDMMPVMVASVYAENLDMGGLSEFTKERVVPAFEGIAGVASVSPSGLIQNQLYISLNRNKIEKFQSDTEAEIAVMIATVTKQMQAAVQARVTELMSEGVPQEEAALTAQAEIFGGHENQQDETENQQFNMTEMLSVDMIRGILFAQNFAMPAGFIEEDGDDLAVRVGDRLRTTEEVENLLLFEIPLGDFGSKEVRLSDVADIIVTDNSDASYTRVNGNPAVMITMQKQTEFSTSDLNRDIRERMDELTERHSDVGLEFAILMDQGHYIDIIVTSILKNLITGGILAVILLMLFLRDIRPTLVVSISIPVSLMLAFTAMYFTGVSLNIISMSGLALSVGMLIDNSIVVIDNTYRLRNQGMSARKAAIQGAGEVAGAITACTLTTIAVFLPIVFTQGLTRQLFTDLGLTIAYALLASLLIALTVVPASSSAVFHKMKPKESKLFNKFRDGYLKLLKASLKVKWAVLLLALALTIISGLAIYSKGAEFFPPMDSEEIVVNVNMPEGATFEEAVEAAEALGEHITGIPDVRHVGVNVSSGRGGPLAMMGNIFGISGGGGRNLNIDVYVLLTDDSDRTMSNLEIAESIMEKEEILNCQITVTYDSASEMAMLTGDAISVRISGRELDDLRDTALEVAEIIRGVPGAVNVTDGSRRATPELRIRVDKDAAMAKGLTTAQVFMAARDAISNPEAKLSMTLSGLDFEIIIEDSDWREPDREALAALELTAPSGEIVVLSDIAEVYEDIGFISISRTDGMRNLTVRGEIEPGYNVGLVNSAIEAELADYTPRDGCYISVRGEAEAINIAFKDLYLMLAIALIFIYLIMVAQFQSLLSPFIVMFTIPLAFTGGFAALLIAGMTLSIVAMIGLILLAGVIVSNGIVFVDCVNRLRRQGIAKRDALTEAGKIRLRPILMTALTTIAAMSTMTIGMGTGTAMVQPMAVTVVGGLTYATLMTLFVVPCMYDLLHRNRDITEPDDIE